MNIDKYIARELSGQKTPLRWLVYLTIVFWTCAVIAIAG